MVSAAMAHAELHGGDGRGNSGGDAAVPNNPAETRSDSATREYLSSLPGSPQSENETVGLPTVGIDWNDFEVIYQHMPASQRERAKRVQEVGMFNHQILKEYLQTHLMFLYPGQPGILWDYGAWWSRDERHGFTTFIDIVVHGHHQANWGSFVEQWFIHQDYWSNNPSGMPWNED